MFDVTKSKMPKVGRLVSFEARRTCHIDPIRNLRCFKKLEQSLSFKGAKFPLEALRYHEANIEYKGDRPNVLNKSSNGKQVSRQLWNLPHIFKITLLDPLTSPHRHDNVTFANGLCNTIISKMYIYWSEFLEAPY